MADEKDRTTRNEGEGSRSAARAYDEGAERTARSGDVERRAREAERAMEGREGEALRRAEREGRRRAAEEDPQVKR